MSNRKCICPAVNEYLFQVYSGTSYSEVTTDQPGFMQKKTITPEQKKIAKILTTVHKAIEKTAKIIEKTKVLKKCLMQRPVKKQNKAGEVLDSVDDDIEKESNYKEQLKLLKKGLMPDFSN